MRNAEILIMVQDSGLHSIGEWRSIAGLTARIHSQRPIKFVSVGRADANPGAFAIEGTEDGTKNGRHQLWHAFHLAEPEHEQGGLFEMLFGYADRLVESLNN